MPSPPGTLYLHLPVLPDPDRDTAIARWLLEFMKDQAREVAADPRQLASLRADIAAIEQKIATAGRVQ